MAKSATRSSVDHAKEGVAIGSIHPEHHRGEKRAADSRQPNHRQPAFAPGTATRSASSVSRRRDQYYQLWPDVQPVGEVGVNVNGEITAIVMR